MKTIFENDLFALKETGRDYDFVAVIENKTDHDIELQMDDLLAEENAVQNHIRVPANDWIGLVNWEYESGCNLAIAIQNGDMEAIQAA